MNLANAKKIAASLIAGLEACELVAYPDPGSKDGNPWTIGYGSTRGVVKGMTITKAEAKARLVEDLDTAVSRLRRRIGDVMDELTDHQCAALLSFVFNLGVDGAMAKATIWKRLKARAFDQVPLEMMKFVYNDGKKMQGLVNRRTAEIRVWSTEEPGSVPDNPSSAVTRATPTPPAPTDPVAPQKSATLITGALGVATTVPVAAKSVSEAIEPYKDASPIVGQMFAMIATIAAVAMILVLALTWLKKREARR